MVRANKWLMITLLIAMPGVHTAFADIYTFKDANGIIHLTNVPTDPSYTLALREGRPMDVTIEASSQDVRTRQHRYLHLVEKVAREHNIDPALINAVITVESSFDPRAISNKGAVGLMQLMPETASRYGVTDRYNPEENVRAGAVYLRDLMLRYDGNIPLALAAYNAGEEAVERYGNQIPPNRETPAYVTKVMELYRRSRPNLQ